MLQYLEMHFCAQKSVSKRIKVFEYSFALELRLLQEIRIHKITSEQITSYVKY